MGGQICSGCPVVLQFLLLAWRELCCPHTPPPLVGGGWTENDPECAGPAAVPSVGLEDHISQRSGVDALADARLKKWLVWHWEVSPLLFLKM